MNEGVTRELSSAHVRIRRYIACLRDRWELDNVCLSITTAVPYIECFHMTSRWPYWGPITMKRRPYWCPKPVLSELNSFLMQTLSFVPINLRTCWPREWKHSIVLAWLLTSNGTKLPFQRFVLKLRWYSPEIRPNFSSCHKFSLTWSH